MPTTPMCQPSPQTTRALGSRSATSRSATVSASASTPRSILRRSMLASSSALARSRARSGLSVVSSSITSSGVPRRPAAFSRGPILKPTSSVVSGRRPRSHTSSRAWRPGCGERRSEERPAATSRRFCPRSGTTSQTVASATRPMASRRKPLSLTGSTPRPRSLSATAQASWKASPQPQRSCVPAPSSGPSASTRGLTMATAGGTSSPGRWWSVMMTSRPSSTARRTGSMAVTPLSTVTATVTPSAARASMARIESP